MHPKKKIKKRLLALVAIVLVAALGVGIWFGAQGGEPVNVYSFQYIGMTEFWGDMQESYGPVTTDKTQTEFLSDTQTVTEIKVKNGDLVKKGDVLFTFDTTLDSLSLERKRLDVEKIKVQIKAAEERLQETKEMVPYVPPEPEKPEKEDLGEKLKDKKYKISENSVYDGSRKETALICWLKDGTSITDAILQELYETSVKYQKENVKKQESAGKDQNKQQKKSNASAPPEAPTQESTETQPVEQTYRVPGFFTCNGESVKADNMTVGKDGYRIRSSYTYQGKTYWLESAVPRNKNAKLDKLKIEPYPQEEEAQAAWEEKWKDGVDVRYIRAVTVRGSQLKDNAFAALDRDEAVELEIDRNAVFMFSANMEQPPEDTQLKLSVAPANGIFRVAYNEDHLILSAMPEKLTKQPETYTVTARFAFDDNYGENRAVEESFSFSVSVVSPDRAKLGTFYVVFKTTEKNYLKGVPTVWQGAKVTAYEDGSFHMQLFDASGFADHTLPPPEEIEIELPQIDPNAMYTAEQILEMQKQCYATIKEQTEKLKLAESEYKIMEREVANGNVCAEIDGKVVALLTEEEAKTQKQPLVKVSGGGGYYIEGSVSELERDQLQIGQEVTVNDWNTGSVYTGKVTSIGDFPSGNDGWNGRGNPTASYYPFKAFVGEEADLQAGSYVSMSYYTSSAQQGIYLEKAFVRTDEAGAYIFVQGADSRLEKRYVQLGKTLWGSYYEILSPLGETDYLAFPYGKHVKDGAPTVESDISALYAY